MKILEIYKQYQITQSLQQHQLRVAAVARRICDNISVPVDNRTVITACLLHDMGNILKFDFSQPDHFFQPEGRHYWKQVREDMAQKYQTQNEHELSMKIAEELGVGSAVLECIDSVGFSQAEDNLARREIEPKICDNADLRVGPLGVLSVKERLEEGRRRYEGRPDKWISAEHWERLTRACLELEDQLFAKIQIKPADITDESIAPLIEELKAYEIEPPKV